MENSYRWLTGGQFDAAGTWIDAGLRRDADRCGFGRFTRTDSVIWWRWDDEGKCWRPMVVPQSGPFVVSGSARLIPIAAQCRWAMLARGRAKVNGLPCLPLEVLEDRDEIRIGDEHYHFSAQSPADVATFEGSEKEIRCGRCLSVLAKGDRIVRCPGCRAHYHNYCWRYDVRCQKCATQTGRSTWIPDAPN